MNLIDVPPFNDGKKIISLITRDEAYYKVLMDIAIPLDGPVIGTKFKETIYNDKLINSLILNIDC